MKNKTHIVLDLETLGTEPGCVVLSVGYAVVQNAHIVFTGEHAFDPHEQKDRTVSVDTLQWWMDGTKADAQRHLTQLPKWRAGVVFEAMHNNLAVFGGWEKALVWGNAPSFDCAILGELHESVLDKPRPWKFWNERCLRTLRAMHNAPRSTPVIPHTALYDAMAEAEDLCDYLRTLP